MFRLSNHLKMGMTNLNVDSKYGNLQNQNDSCKVLQLLNNIVGGNPGEKIDMAEQFNDWSRNISKYSRDRIVISKFVIDN